MAGIVSGGLRRKGLIAVGAFLAVVVVGALAFEPVTRSVVATNDLCSYCHVPIEYRAEVRLSYSRPHPPLAGDAEEANDTSDEEPQARCVECHLPSGVLASVYAYTHFASLTDLFGGLRHRTRERAGNWLPPRQAAAYRVRDAMFEHDSPTCRACHDMDEIKPRRERGVNAHKKAIDEDKTCIECHYNEKHRAVDVRDEAFQRPEQSKSS